MELKPRENQSKVDYCLRHIIFNRTLGSNRKCLIYRVQKRDLTLKTQKGEKQSYVFAKTGNPWIYD